MSTSMILLVALQGFWLSNSYEKAAGDLRAETSRLLRETVTDLRDSMLLKDIEAIPTDSIRKTHAERSDSMFSFTPGRPMLRTEGQVQIYISSTTGEDSARQVLRTVASRYNEGALRSHSRYSIRIRNDSLSLDSIQAGFHRQLKKHGISLGASVERKGSMPHFPSANGGQVRVRRMPDPESVIRVDPSVFDHSLQTNWVRVDPFFTYTATLQPVRPLLLREIAPQILFSGFLSMITLASFAVMYRSIRSQQRLMEQKNDFINNITHELKTPIATVSVALEALKDFKGIDNPKTTAEYLDIAQHELNRLSILAERVLATSLLDEHVATLDTAPVDMAVTVNTVINSMKPLMEKAQANCSYEKQGDDFIVAGSSIHLTHVVYNLLDNALKYSPENPEVTVELVDDGNRVLLSVRDKGIGIPPEYQSRIFERFFRMPSGDVHNVKGYGLGLSYVDQVVRQHGGSIALTSLPGQGSLFTVTLPKKQG